MLNKHKIKTKRLSTQDMQNVYNIIWKSQQIQINIIFKFLLYLINFVNL